MTRRFPLLHRAEIGRLAGPAVFALAALVRLLHVFAIRESWAVRYPMVDALAYHEKALAILAGDWLGDRIFYQDPLYPYALAGLYALFGAGSVWVLAAQSLLDAGTAWLCYALARRVFGLPAALLAGLFAALYLPSIYYVAFVEKTALSVFLLTLALALLLRADAGAWRPAAWLGAGAALGVASLTRGQYLALAPIALVWIAAARARAPRERARAAAALALGTALAVLPVALRNYAVGRDLVLTQSGLGANLYIGNARANDTGSYLAPPFVRAHPRFEEVDFRAEAERRSRRPLAPSEVSGFWLRETMREIAADPGHFARHSLWKARLYTSHFEVPDNDSFYYFAAEVAPWLALPGPSFGALFPLALIGLALAPRTRGAALLAACGLVYSASVIAFFVMSRYRMPIAPLVCAFAAHGGVRLAGLARERAWLRLAPALAALVLAWLFVNADVGRDDLALSHLNLGAQHLEQARLRLARAEELGRGGQGEQASAERGEARSFLALAESELRAGFARRPQHALLREKLRDVLLAQVAAARAAADAEAALAAARALASGFPRYAPGQLAAAEVYLEQDRLDEARAALRHARAAAPGNPRVRALQAELDARQARPASP